MKKLMLLVFVLLIGCASTLTREQKMIQYIVVFEGMKKAQIFNKSSQWLAEKFDSQGQFTYKNLEEGRLAGNFKSNTNMIFGVLILRISLEIEVKDGKARLTFVPLGVTSCGDRGCGPESDYIDEGRLDLTKEHAEYWKQEYETYVKATQKKKSDNW